VSRGHVDKRPRSLKPDAGESDGGDCAAWADVPSSRPSPAAAVSEEPQPAGRRWEAALFLTSNCASVPVAALSSNVFGTRYELSLDASVHPFEGAAPGSGGGGAGGGWLGAPRRDKPQELASVLYKTKLRGFMRPRRCGPEPVR